MEDFLEQWKIKEHVKKDKYQVFAREVSMVGDLETISKSQKKKRGEIQAKGKARSNGTWNC